MDAYGQLLRQAFDAAVAAAHPRNWLPPAIRGLERPAGAVRVLALGKSAIPMAEVFAATVDGPWSGLAVTPAGVARPVGGFDVLEAAHPVPDAASLAAGEAALCFAAGAGSDDLLLILISGGASALACAPIRGVSLEAKAEATARLLASGAGIGEVNTVRRALSRLKGGGVARARGEGRILTLAASDVPGDALADIGSGPGIISPTGVAEALNVLDRRAPDLVRTLAGPMHAWAASATPIAAGAEGRVVLSIDSAVRAAADFLAGAGWRVDNLGVLGGGVGAAATLHVDRMSAGRVLVSGGELDVPVAARSPGRGGRNQHFLITLAARLARRDDIWALAADTDGLDGSSPAAGGWIDPEFLAHVTAAEAQAALSRFDAHGLLATKGRLIETGRTGVNVGDLRMVLVA